jgi:GTPase SAR1 family protein
MTILVIGSCGVGKTWVMRQLIAEYRLKTKAAVGKVKMRTDGKIAVLGVYTGSVFDGSDKLSMSVSTDFDALKRVKENRGMTFICEGDRFMVSKFITLFNPIVIKIAGDGKKGRSERGSTQSERQIKSIATRVAKIIPTHTANSSGEALEHVKKLVA